MKIGIIGLGFVGQAIKNTYDGFLYELVLIDTDPKKETKGTYEELKDSDGVFVCVPSPSRKDGTCNTDILHSVLTRLKDMGYKQPIISKVTAPPHFYRVWGTLLPNLTYSPEFLTAANASLDYRKSKFVVIGGTIKAYQKEAAYIIQKGLEGVYIYYSSLEEAAMMKYTINCFLATKVSFMNEIYRICEESGIDYNQVKKLVILDQRIGNSHMDVPGPDGQFGYGGMCFPKDMSALLNMNKIPKPILGTIIKQNELIRSKNA